MLDNREKENIDFQSLISRNKIVLVDFFASWCEPCKRLMPVLEEVLKNKKEITLFKIDIDLNPNLIHIYQIKSFPTLVLFKQGKEIKRKIGYCSSKELSFFLETYEN